MLTDISPVGLSTDQAAPNSAQESYYVNSALMDIQIMIQNYGKNFQYCYLLSCKSIIADIEMRAMVL